MPPSRSGSSPASRRATAPSSASTTNRRAPVYRRARRSAAGRRVGAHLRATPLADGISFARRTSGRCRTALRRSPSLDGVGRCAGDHNAQNAACCLGSLPLRSALPRERIRRRAEDLSRPRLTAWSSVGRTDAVLSTSTIPRRPTPMRRHARLSCFPRIYWIAGGQPKEGGIAPLARVVPAHPPRPT